MGTNYWMFVENKENSEITRNLNYELFGVGSKYKRRAQRMKKNDRVIFYTRTLKAWTATATIKEECFEDTSQTWLPKENIDEFKYRVTLKPNHILKESNFLNASYIGPRLEYVKKWIPEDWHLAFWDTLHLLPQKDFKLLEDAIKKHPSIKIKK